MNKLNLLKTATSFTVGLGTMKVAGSIIANNVPPPKNLFEKVSIGLASTVIGLMAADATQEYTDKFFDGLIVTYTKTDKEIHFMVSNKNEEKSESDSDQTKS